MNHGLIIPKIETKEDGAEHILGGVKKLKGEIINPSGNWLPFLVEKEYQRIGSVETNNCTGYGTLNCVETLLRSKGVFANYSDRYLGIMAGTFPPGNDPHKVAETLRKTSGCLDEELLPFTNIQTVEEYYKPRPMTTELLKKGQEWYNVHDFSHDWVFNGGSQAEKKEKLRQALQVGTVGISVYAWQYDGDKNYYVKPTGAQDNHWVQLVRINEANEFVIFDSYDGFVKKLSPDYDFAIAKVFYLSPAGPKLSILQKILSIIGELLKIDAILIQKKIEKPITTTPENKIKLWAKQIELAEGYGTDKAVTITKYMNPGAIKGSDGTFKMFNSYEEGMAYLCDYLTRACTGKHLAYPRGGETTLNEFTKIYVGDDHNYAPKIAVALGITVETKIKELL